MSAMFDQALGAQKEEEIARLKEEIARLQTSPSPGQDQPGFTYLSVQSIVALRLPEDLKQPRRYFDPVKIAKLKDSIAKHGGVLEPILVRPGVDGKYETVSGERRWRCCVDLNIDTMPAMVTEMDDETALEVALIAHLLSEDISAIEETDSIMGLLSLRLGLSFEAVKHFLIAVKNYQTRGELPGDVDASPGQIAIAEAILEEFDLKLGSFVSNRLPLLNLAPDILAAVRSGHVSPTNATLINRTPPEWHPHLLTHCATLTKADLQAEITRLKTAPTVKAAAAKTAAATEGIDAPGAPIPIALESDNSRIIEPPLPEQLYHRIRAIRRRKRLLSDEQVQQHLATAHEALEAIAHIAAHKGIQL
jgi:ParB family chromosome partitioning protein